MGKNIDKCIDTLIDGLLEIINPFGNKSPITKDFLRLLFQEYTQAIIETNKPIKIEKENLYREENLINITGGVKGRKSL